MRWAVLITGAIRGLEETTQLAQETWREANTTGNLRVLVEAVDLSDSGDYAARTDAVLNELKAADMYDRVFLVHNAGSLGSLGFVQELPSPTELAKHWELNVTSVLWLTKRFLDEFGASREQDRLSTASPDGNAGPKETTTQLLVMNVSSRSAIAPYQTLGMYCTVKAAREMHFRVLAAEQAMSNKVRVLSYSPGAMDTDMQQTMRESSHLVPALSKWFMEMKTEGTLVPTATSSRLGVLLAISNDFETGRYVTYQELVDLEKRGSRAE
ncbi:hypothetical protein BBJ28_00004809 [Nothophytophthora sp. Chile5]|nr:hypothetical protein BBJ28_00004809 [Nothophytophthora sp. Chile5]